MGALSLTDGVMDMAGRPRKPMAVQESKRRVHRSKEEKDARKASESLFECPITEFEAPSYLTKTEKARFNDISALLQSVNKQLCTALDADQLARYVVAESQYKTLSRKTRAAMRKIGSEPNALANANQLQLMQNRAFAQLQTCASALGLNVSSRLKFDIPKPDDEPEDEFDQFES